MWKIGLRRLVVNTILAAITAGAIALGGSPAFAADTWTVDNPNIDGSFTDFLSPRTTAGFGDSNTGHSFICTSSTILGTAPNGTGLPEPITAISISYSSCTGPLGSMMSGGLTGSFHAETYEPMSGTTLGDIAVTFANLTINNILGACKVSLTGDVAVTYANDGTLTTSATALTATAASGAACAPLVNPGDTFTAGATYDTTPVMTISSP